MLIEATDYGRGDGPIIEQKIESLEHYVQELVRYKKKGYKMPFSSIYIQLMGAKILSIYMRKLSSQIVKQFSEYAERTFVGSEEKRKRSIRMVRQLLECAANDAQIGSNAEVFAHLVAAESVVNNFTTRHFPGVSIELIVEQGSRTTKFRSNPYGPFEYYYDIAYSLS